MGKKKKTLIDFSKIGVNDDYKMELKEAREQLIKLRPRYPTSDEGKLNQKAIDISLAVMDAYENLIGIVKDYLAELGTE